MINFKTISHSLAFRLIVTLTLFQFIVVLLFAISFTRASDGLFDDADYNVVNVVDEFSTLLLVADDGVSMDAGADLVSFQDQYPDFWALVRYSDFEFSYGPVPLKPSIDPNFLLSNNIKRLTSGTGDAQTYGEVNSYQVEGEAEVGVAQDIVLALVVGGVNNSQAEQGFWNFVDTVWAYVSSSDLAFLILGSPIILGLIIAFAMRSLSQVADTVRSIRPEDMDVRLSSENIPNEIKPLVDAMNGALDRLDTGYQRLGQFTGAAAHELRTPLALMGIYLKEVEPGEPREKLELIISRLRHIIDQILALALFHQEKTVFEGVDLVTLARDVVADRAPLALSQKVDIELLCSEQTVEIKGLEGALFSAMSNLVDNALEHANGATRISVEVFKTGFRVIDNGAGVPSRFAEKAFEPFVQLEKSGAAGFGLGLAIVKQIVDRHGGLICLQDTPGGGATFEIKLP